MQHVEEYVPIEVPTDGNLKPHLIKIGIPEDKADEFLEQMKKDAKLLGTTPEAMLEGVAAIVYKDVPKASDLGLHAVLPDSWNIKRK